jgi:hypothetical protein
MLGQVQTPVTVYPAVADGSPPASFWIAGESYRYMRAIQIEGASCGLCECPAESYAKHYLDTIRTN